MPSVIEKRLLKKQSKKHTHSNPRSQTLEKEKPTDFPKIIESIGKKHDSDVVRTIDFFLIDFVIVNVILRQSKSKVQSSYTSKRMETWKSMRRFFSDFSLCVHVTCLNHDLRLREAAAFLNFTVVFFKLLANYATSHCGNYTLLSIIFSCAMFGRQCYPKHRYSMFGNSELALLEYWFIFQSFFSFRMLPFSTRRTGISHDGLS